MCINVQVVVVWVRAHHPLLAALHSTPVVPRGLGPARHPTLKALQQAAAVHHARPPVPHRNPTACPSSIAVRVRGQVGCRPVGRQRSEGSTVVVEVAAVLVFM